MKIFGSISELVKIVFRKSTKSITVEPAAQTTGSNKTITIPDMTSGDSQDVVLTSQAQTLANKNITGATGIEMVNPSGYATFRDHSVNIISWGDPTKKFRFDNTNITTGTQRSLYPPDASGTLVLEDNTATLTNKTFDADGTGNVLSNVDNTNIKAGAAIDATKIHDGSVDNTEFGYLNGVTSNIQTQLGNKQPLDSELTALAGLTSAADKLPYFTGSGTAGLADFSAAGRALVDDADATAQRATLGLGTIATQAASGVAITGGSITGITDLAVADGGTGSSTASGARTNLGAAASGANTDITSLDSVNLRGMKWNDTTPVDISSGTLALTSNTTVYQITTAGTLTTITGGSDGQVIALQNNTASSCTITNDSSTTDNRILTGTGNNLTLTAGATIMLRFEASAVGSQADNKWYVVGGSGSSSAATGSGEINAILNPSAASDLTGWADGTSHVISRQTAGGPLNPVTSTYFRITSSAATAESNTSGSYFSGTMPSGLQNKKLKAEFYFTSPTTDVWKLSLYNGSGTRYALSTDSPSSTTIPAGTTGKFVTYFDSDSTSSFKLNLTRTTSGGSGLLDFTAAIVGPGIQPQGAVVGPTVTSVISFSGSPVKGTAQTDKFSYQRVGEWLHAQFEYRQTAAGTNGSGTIAVNLPSGLTVNSSALLGVSAGITQVGEGYAFNGATEYPVAITASGGATSLTLFDLSTTNSYSGLTYTDVSFANATAVLSGSFKVPIAEWAGSGTVNLASNDVEYASTTEAFTVDGASTTSYDPAGQPMAALSGLSKTKTVTWKTPIQVSDVIEVQMSLDRVSWFNMSQRSPFTLSAAGGVDASGGYRVNGSAASTTTIQFMGYQNIANDDSPVVEWSNTHYWRVVKHKAGQAVGFGMSTATQAGLVSTTTQTFAGIKNNASMPACSVDATSSITYNLNGGFVDGTWRESGGSNTFDQGGVFTPGTTSASPTAGIFTCPVGGAGTYLITATAKWAGANIVAGGRYLMRIYKNSNILVDNDIYAHAAGRVVIPTRNIVCQLSAGDIVYARFLSDQNHTVNTVSITGDETLISIAKLY